MRISTTTIEAFRLWQQPDEDWMSEDDLIANIRGEFVPTHRVEVGLAFGKILETPGAFRVSGGYRCEDIALSDDVIGPALALIDRNLTVFEAKAVGRYGQHDVVYKADQMVGAHVTETKTTLSSFDFDRYAHSCQWRFGLDILKASLITYHVFCLYENNQNRVIELKSIETFNLYPYPELHQDCCELLRRFEAYVTARGLTGLLNQRQADAA